jgi:hypothetical protein
LDKDSVKGSRGRRPLDGASTGGKLGRLKVCKSSAGGLVLRVAGTSVISFQLIDRIEVRSSTDNAVKDIVVYLSDGIVADGQDSAIEKDVLVKVGGGRGGREGRYARKRVRSSDTGQFWPRL